MTTLYLDMDGVVADFDAYAESVLRTQTTSEQRSDGEWQRLRDHKRMFRDLPKTAEADEIVDYCRSFAKDQGMDLYFLTAVPLKNDFPWAFYDKMIWAQTRYPDIPVHFGPYSHDKQVHCQPGDILIDDRTDNISDWANAGGIGIRHRTGDPEHTLKLLASCKNN